MNKKLLFITGTRADYGKIKSLLSIVEAVDWLDLYIFVTGMHTLKKYGDTKNEVISDKYKNIHVYMNQIEEEPMDLVLANTVNGLSRYVRELNPDLLVVHGDRVEALAGAIVGSLNNILVAHIEGGEVSGTIDDSIRHAISKLSHLHFVSNCDAKTRLIQLGENPKAIFEIGSPDIDALIKKPGMDIADILIRYEIPFSDYGIALFHPVTTELDKMKRIAKEFVDALINSNLNYIIIYPNNDMGKGYIFDEYMRLNDISRFKLFPSIRFEFFVELLRNSRFIIGNSSVGIHEAPVLGKPSINVGSRQNGRFIYKSIHNVSYSAVDILKTIEIVKKIDYYETSSYFGTGFSANNFLTIIKGDSIWKTSTQKNFRDL